MPYLSRVRINPLRESGRRLLRNPHVAHAMVLGGIAEQPVRERVLWRLETTNPRRPELLILTESRPDWNHIIEQAGWSNADGEQVVVRDYSPLFAQLVVGREFAFRLTANPVQHTRKPEKLTPAQERKLASDQGEKPRSGRAFRVGHRTAAHQLDWLLRRTPSWGFEIPVVAGFATPDDGEPADVPRDVRIVARQVHRFHKGTNGPQVVLATATFEGRLRVTDPDLLAEKLLSGVGPAKAYGCGLLTLAPLPGARHHA